MSHAGEVQASTRSLEERVRLVRDLPTLPVVVTTALQMLNDSEATLRDVGEVVATDQVLSARTLRLVNAPFFGLRRRLTSVVEASVYLGRNGMRNVVVSSGVMQAFGPRPAVRFWEHSFASAIYARLLAKHACPGREDDAYLAALVHDLGRLVLECHFAEEYARLEYTSAETGRPLAELEAEAWQATHADVGFWLGRTWNLPETVLEATRLHHRPAEATGSDLELATVVHTADELAFEMGLGDSDRFDAEHLGLALGADLMVQQGRLLVSPDSLRELAASEAQEVRLLVEMIYEP